MDESAKDLLEHCVNSGTLCDRLVIAASAEEVVIVMFSDDREPFYGCMDFPVFAKVAQDMLNTRN